MNVFTGTFIFVFLLNGCKWSERADRIRSLRKTIKENIADEVIYLGNIQKSSNPKYIVYHGRLTGIEGFECSDRINVNFLWVMTCKKQDERIDYIYGRWDRLSYSQEVYIRAMTESVPAISLFAPDKDFEEKYSLQKARYELSLNRGDLLYCLYVGDVLFQNTDLEGELTIFFPDDYNIQLQFKSEKESFTTEKIKQLASEIKFVERNKEKK